MDGRIPKKRRYNDRPSTYDDSEQRQVNAHDYFIRGDYSHHRSNNSSSCSNRDYYQNDDRNHNRNNGNHSRNHHNNDCTVSGGWAAPRQPPSRDDYLRRNNSAGETSARRGREEPPEESNRTQWGRAAAPESDRARRPSNNDDERWGRLPPPQRRGEDDPPEGGEQQHHNNSSSREFPRNHSAIIQQRNQWHTNYQQSALEPRRQQERTNTAGSGSHDRQHQEQVVIDATLHQNGPSHQTNSGSNQQSITHNTNNEADYQVIPMEEFEQKSLQQKMSLFLPFEETFQHDATGVFEQIYPIRYPNDFEARVSAAVQGTIKYAHVEWSKKEDVRIEEARERLENLPFGESDEEEDEVELSKRPLDPIIPKFIHALPHCVPLYFGLLADDEQKPLCWCPLSRKLNKTWQKQFGLDHALPICATGKATKYMLDHALVDHMEKQSNGCFYHAICHEYLKQLFSNYYGPEIHHQALHKVGTSRYRKARNAQKSLMHAELRSKQKEIFELEKKNEQLQKENEELKRVNPTKASQLEAFQALMKKFDIEDTPAPPKPTKKQLAGNRKMFDLWFDNIRERRSFSKKKNTIQIEIPEESDSLDDVLKHLQTNQHALFDEGSKKSHHWLYDWNVHFKSSVIEDAEHTSIKELKMLADSKAKDKGGPSRQFLSFVWDNMKDLKIDGFHLFEFSSGELWPKTNDLIKHKGVVPQAKALSRALGRLLLHAITNRVDLQGEFERFSVANHVLPQVLRRYLLQGVSPMDHTYDTKALLWDVTKKIFSDHDKKKIDIEEEMRSTRLRESFSFFLQDSLDDDEVGFTQDNLRKAAFKSLIKARSIVLDAILEGIGFDKSIKTDEGQSGSHRFIDVFSYGSDIQVLDCLFFSESKVSVENLIELMAHVQYDDKVRGDHQIHQLQLFSVDNNCVPSGILVDVIRKLSHEDERFPADFLEFVTGSRFLPQDKESNEILVEFNSSEISNDEACVESHSCNRVIKFPGTAYHGKAQVVEEKLLMSLKYSGKSFGMK